MMDRKKKLRFIQLFLLIVGLSLIYLTYYNKEVSSNKGIVSKNLKDSVESKAKRSTSNDGDVFFDIEYSGLDLNGNRYVLKSKEAFLDKIKSEIVYMKFVKAIFYFKDDTILYISADNAVYNNQTLDMEFKENVEADYLNSKLFANNASFSNTENYLTIQGDVKINDIKGNLIADKLLFDITKQKLKISTFNNGKINANVKLNEKRF